MRRGTGAALVIAAGALWGTLGLFGKLLYEDGLTPLELTSVRAAVGFLGLGLYAAVRGRRLRRPPPRDVAFFALYGAVSIALFEYLYFAAVERLTLSLAAALLYTAPAFVIVLSRARGARLSNLQIASLFAVLAGVALVTGAARAVLAGTVAVSGAGVLLGLGAGLTYALYTIFGKHALRTYDAVETVLYAFAFGALVLGILVPPWRPFTEHPDSALLLLMMGIFPTMIAYLCYIVGLRVLHPGTASMLATIEPVVATLLGLLVLGEALFAEQAAGILLIVGTAVVLARSGA